MWTTPTGALALLILGFMALLAILGPVLFSNTAGRIDVAQAFLGPSGHHPFGTDRLGRDIFARTLVAARTSLELAGTATAIGLAIGVVVGGMPSVLGRRVQRAVAAVINGMIAFPGVLVALFVNTIIGIGAQGAVLGLGIALVPTFARLAQTMSAKVASLEYVAAARVLGVSRVRLVFRHILPNVAEPLILTACMALGWSLLGISALSFLGLGVRPPSYDWGALLADGLTYIYENPLAALGPGLFLVLASLGFNLLGESLARLSSRDASFTETRGRRRKLRGQVWWPASPVSETASPARSGAGAALHVTGLTVMFGSGDAVSYPVRDVSFDVGRGEIVGIVGESGSGKTMTALAVAQLVPYPGEPSVREISWAGQDVSTMSGTALRELLAASVSVVFQDPMSSLNPALRIGTQLSEVAEVHKGISRKDAMKEAASRLADVQVPNPARRLRQYPHEFSGGMRQRAAIAMSLMADVRLVIADEPTTALDVSVQHRVLELLRALNAQTGAAILLISHDLSVVSSVCDRILVMYAGEIVEEVTTEQLTKVGPAHPYTKALLDSIPLMTATRHQPLRVIPGRPPRARAAKVGCPFAPRCDRADGKCRAEAPPLTVMGPDGHRAACWHPHGTAAGLDGTATPFLAQR